MNETVEAGLVSFVLTFSGSVVQECGPHLPAECDVSNSIAGSMGY